MNRQTRVLITGASGTIGRQVLRQLLLEKKYKVTVFDLKTYDSAVFLIPLKNKIRLTYGDITNKHDVDKVTSDIDIVIHLAGELPLSADLYPELGYKVNYGGTCNLLNSLQENSPHCHFFYASSIAVYGNRFYNAGINVHDYLYPDTHYADTKKISEELLKNSSLKWSIFRICTVLGYNNYAFDGWIFERSLDSILEFITPQDTARAFVSAVEKKEKLINSTYNLGGGESCRTNYADFLADLFACYGLGKLNFPEKTFSNEKCANRFYSDSEKLDEILNFRQDDLESYFNGLRKSVNPIKRLLTFLFSGLLKRYLIKQSIPYRNYKKKNKDEFYNTFSPVYA